MKRWILTLITGLCALGIGPRASADISITLTPTPQNINLSDIASFDVMINGLGGDALAHLGAYNLDFLYNPAILSADSALFGNDVGGAVAGGIQLSDLGVSLSGDLNLFEVSGLLDLSGQPNSFKIATIGFKGIGAGTSPITLDPGFSLSNADGSATLTLGSFTGASVTVNSPVAGVPDTSSTCSLLILGFSGLAILRRKLQVRN